MEMKAVLLLFVIGVAVVAAKKGSSEEDDRLGPYGQWANQRPFGHGHGHGPKPFKFRNPKHHQQFPVYVVARPEGYPANGPMPPQQSPQYPQGAQQLLTPYDVQAYVENLQRNVAQISEKVYSEFQTVEAEIERNRQSMESFLVNQFQSMSDMLATKKEREVLDAVKTGKDQEKIESCLKEQEEVFKAEVEMDLKRNSDCFNDATSRARQILTGARNLYTDKSITSAFQVKEMTYQINACVNQRDNYCAYEKMAAINQRVRATAEEGERQVQKIQEAPRQQMIQANYCRQNFMRDLRDIRVEYNDLVKKCISSVEVPEVPVQVPEVPVQVPEVPAEVPEVPAEVPEVSVQVPEVPEVPEVVVPEESVEVPSTDLENDA